MSMSSRAIELLFAPWWEQILMGIIPHEWEQEDGSLRLAGESAAEFMAILKENEIQPTEELLEACNEYAVRIAIHETGKHPNATPGWEDTYGE